MFSSHNLIFSVEVFVASSKADSVVDAAGASICGPPGGSDVSTVSAMEAAESLIELSLGEGSTDNISAIVVKFPKLIRSKLWWDKMSWVDIRHEMFCVFDV